MSREQLEVLTRRYLEATFEEIEQRLALEWSEPAIDAHRWDLNDEAHRLSASLASADYTAGLAWARELMPEVAGDTCRRLARRLIEAKLEAIKAELSALAGEPLRMPTLAIQPAPPAERPPAAPSLRISELASRYAEERVARKRWTARSAAQYREIYAVIVDLLGDPPVETVTKANMRSLGLALTKFPSNVKKVFPGLTPSEALEQASDDRAVARLAPSSVNMYQQAARSLFKWALAHDHIHQNPATVLDDVKTGHARDDRKPFDDEDLVRYFAGLKASDDQPFMFWIPRILAYSGCRLGEVAQLRKDDICQRDAVWCFDINEEGPEKRLKTHSSRRVVPIHRRLLELGFLEFVRASVSDFLWPREMRTAARADRSPIDKLQKRLAVHMRTAGISDPRKTAAHSFRHTVASRLAAAGAAEHDIAAILGHEQRSITLRRYADKQDARRLSQVLSLLVLPV